jgi:cell wall assembly regulator SMI1
MHAAQLWSRYTHWLAQNAPASHANLAPSATDEQVSAVEQATGARLPEDVVAVWKTNDGQKQTMLANKLAPGSVCLPTLSFLSTALVIAIWREWAELRATTDIAALDAPCRSIVPGLVRPLYTHPGWIPLWSDPTRADYIGLDLAPGDNGTPGQIINFGRNEEDHFCCARSFGELLQILVEEVESGAWPATEMGYGDRTIPWLGDPRQSFFNALSARAERANPPVLSVGQQLSAALREGQAALKRSDFAGAKAAIELARSLKSQHAPTEGLLVQVLVAEGNVPAARAALDALLAWAPRFPDAPALQKLLQGKS